MGSFLFKWDHPATEVYVTGTFDNWAKSFKLEKKDGTRFEKLVDLPRSDEKYFYKFVVDDKWTTDHMAPQETDEHHNTNNILLPENITKHSTSTQFAAMSTVTPASTTAALAGQVPKDGGSSALPGSFPETPAAVEKQDFGVNPLPATSGFGNPIHTTPGEALPPTGQYTSNNVTSAVTLDKESYEKGAAAAPVLPNVVTPEAERDANGSGMFGLPASIKNLIPESSLPMGAGATTGKDAGPFMQSAGANTTTADLAGKVPLERSAVPEVVSESQAKAGFDPEASANPEVVREKTAMEKELESKVPEQPVTSDGSAPNSSSPANGGVKGIAAGAAAGATAAAAGAAAYVSNGKIGGSSTATAPGTAIAPTVPDVVQESIAESHQSPEAAASKEMVREKGAVEAELLHQVKPDNSTGEHAPTAAATTSAASASSTVPKPTMKSTETPLSTSTISKWKGTDAAPATAATEAKDTTSKPSETTSPTSTAAATAGGLSPPAATTPAIDDSRDVSPMSRPSGQQPEVTTGVASSQTTTVSKPAATNNEKTTLAAAAAVGPSSEGVASSTTTSTTADAKKEKRKSGFFGKLKSKFENRDKK